jgi:CheY-like chemotaxis protein
MPQRIKPHVLIVDDEPDQARGLKIAIDNKASVEIVHPEELTDKSTVTEADLILVDYRLEDWKERDNTPSVCQKPLDGLALAAVLRSYTDNKKDSSPTAMAILSGHLVDLSGGLPPEPRAHAIARAHNLEWAFSKANPHAKISLAQQVLSLAAAVKELPSTWPIDNLQDSETQLQRLFALPKSATWFPKAWEEIQDCHPPFHELSKWSHGLAILRWMLHRILPYPCFLMDVYQLAARLRVTPNSLEQVMAGKSKLAKIFEAVRYNGILDNFLGTRWWRAGIESVLWSATNGKSFDPAATSAILKRFSPRFELLNITQPVVCLDADYQPLNAFADINSAVRFQPDDWPPYADQAWTMIELANQEHRLKALVLRQDLQKLR